LDGADRKRGGEGGGEQEIEGLDNEKTEGMRNAPKIGLGPVPFSERGKEGTVAHGVRFKGKARKKGLFIQEEIVARCKAIAQGLGRGF